MSKKLDKVEFDFDEVKITIAPEFMGPFQRLMDIVWEQVVDQDEDEEGGLTCNIFVDQVAPCDRAFLASIFHNFETVENAQEFLSVVQQFPEEERHDWYTCEIISIANESRYR